MSQNGIAGLRAGHRWTDIRRLAAVLLLCLAGGCSDGAATMQSIGDGAPDLPTLQAALQAEFARLGIDPARVAAVAPAGAANAVFDLHGEIHMGDPPIIVFSWTERMLGDYNQDGLVGVSDLTPIGQRYDESVDYDDPAAHGGIAHWPTGDPDDTGAANWRLARVDGNDDGLIYLSDITTIAQHWEERISGYRLYYQTPLMADFEMLPNPGEPGSPLTIPRSVADPEDPGRPFRYALSYTPPPDEEGLYQFYVAPYDDGTDTEGTPSPVLTLPEGEPPTAALTAAPLYGNPPMDVDFDASGSFAAEGEIVDYAWDFYGSGFFATHTDVPYAENTYTGGGTYTASVRVEDSQHLTDTASVEITTNTPPVAVIEAEPGSAVVPFNTAITVDDSYDPDGEIVLYEWDNCNDGTFESSEEEPINAMQVVTVPGEHATALRVTDNDGLTDTAVVTVTALYGEWDIQTLDNSFTNAGEGCSLAKVSDVPAIAYYHMGQQCLMLTRASDGLGTGTWYTPQNLTLVDAEDEGKFPSLAVISGNPAVAYLDEGLSAVRYERATHPSGSEWVDEPVTVFPNLAFYISLCEVDGRPAMAYQTAGNDIYYQLAVDDLGDDWSALPRDIDGGAQDHFNPVLAVIGGTPGITCMRTVAAGQNALMYVHASDAAGAEPWNEPVAAYRHVFDSTGIQPSLAEVAGNPALTFNRCPVTFVEGVPVFVRSDSATGATGTWSVALPVELSDDPHVGSVRTSMAVINYIPHVVYYDANLGSLWHVWGSDHLGGSWLEPTLVDGGGGNDIGAFCSLANINGHPAVAYQDSTAGTLKYAVLH